LCFCIAWVHALHAASVGLLAAAPCFRLSRAAPLRCTRSTTQTCPPPSLTNTPAAAAAAAAQTKKMVLVVAVALIDSQRRVLLAQRPAGKAMAGLWEFPGGKVGTGADGGCKL